MTSHRRRKKDAVRAGLSEPELRLVELCEEILERFRWLQVLTHAQSFILRDRLKITDEELDRVLRAATQTVDDDAARKRWQEGLARLKAELLEGRRGIRREKKREARERRRGGATHEESA